MLQSLGSQRVRPDLATEQEREEIMKSVPESICLKTCFTSFPGAECLTVYLELPSGCVKGQQLQRQRGRWQMPLASTNL